MTGWVCRGNAAVIFARKSEKRAMELLEADLPTSDTSPHRFKTNSVATG